MHKIEVTENGPYLVTGGVPLLRVEIVTNAAGESVAWREIERLDAGQTYSLCRCGASAIKPFCD
ncbi:MAG: CDGSH iron-sulfur domain-containing protein, partial [Actinomycetota bacterium]|nr:CDGSH iron-sulfur domain-containing protein [Actinomycetota bacterium]